MKLKFEEWVERGAYSPDAKHLLNSGATCYKAGAYTASLLMSYLGFLVIIKDRIMASNKPPLYPQGKWDKLLAELRFEDKWEAAVIDALKEQETRGSGGRTKDPVFNCNDSVRAQVVYWKDRRNDCVHHKDNEITSAHVETFWSFLQSNLQKITVPGGQASLLNQFRQFYDIAYTPAGEDVSPLVAEIKSSVEKAELDAFWPDLFGVANNLIDYGNEIKLIHALLSLSDAEMDQSLVKYLKGSETMLMHYLARHPELIGSLGYTAQEIRNLWMKRILKGPRPLKVFTYMLRTGLIPPAEKDEALEYYADRLVFPQNMGDHQTLLDNGFGEFLYKRLFVKEDTQHYEYWKFLHAHGQIATYYIEHYPIKDGVVKILIKLFGETYIPYSLQDGLRRIFEQKPLKKKEFEDIGLRLGLTLPGTLQPVVV